MGLTNDTSLTIGKMTSGRKSSKSKGKSQPTKNLYNYFSVVDKRRDRRPVQKNFQGFLLTSCRYEEELKDFVYCPYGMQSDANSSLCHECCFRPCILSQRWDEIGAACDDGLAGPSFESPFAPKRTVEDMYCRAMTAVEDQVLVPIFGRKYVDSHVPPSCVLGHVTEYFEAVGSDLAEEAITSVCVGAEVEK